jgi:hypothetical protein
LVVPTTQTLTPTEAFEQLRERAARGLLAGRDSRKGRLERFQYEYAVLDQSAAFPGRRVPVILSLQVVATDGGELVLHLRANWSSIYGHHSSSAEYVVAKTGSKVSIVPTWQQTLPNPTLDHIDIHTGNVSVGDYHQKTLDGIRDYGRTVSAMLFDGTERTVDSRDLIGIAEVVQRLTPLL